MTMHGDRAEVTPFGLAGGTNGGGNILRLRRAANSDVEEELGMHAVGIRLEPGDHLIYRSNGGGGFGHPLERDPARVLADVELGWISEAKARDVYGIVLRADGPAKNRYVIDQDATAQMRAKLADQPRVRGYGPGEVHPLGEMLQIAEVGMVAE